MSDLSLPQYADTGALPEVEEVRVLRLQPGDIIVARVHDRVTAQQAQTTVERLKEFFKDHEVLVCSGLTLEVARPEQSDGEAAACG